MASDASAQLEIHRQALRMHCYRLTGCLQDAEDLTQETLVRAWQKLSGFRGDSSLATWLHRIATNLCLDFMRSRRSRPLPGTGAGRRYVLGEELPEPTGEVLWMEPCPDPEGLSLRREQVSLAFLTLLQTIPARQRAALVLSDVLGYSARETAEALETTPAAVNSALQRARKTLGPLVENQAISPAPELLDRFLRAWDEGDAAAIVALMREDAIMIMPPYPVWVQGRPDILRVFQDYPMNGDHRWKLVPCGSANGDPAFGFYSQGADGLWHGWGIQVLTVSAHEGQAQVEHYYVFKGAHLLPWFGLPDPLPPY